MATTYRLISTEEELEQLIHHCLEMGVASIDFETNAQPIYKDEFTPTMLGVSFQVGSSWIIPLDHFESPFEFKWKKVFGRFCDMVITNPSILKIAWNLNFENSIFNKYGYRMRGRVFDAMLAKYILDETRPNDLKSMVDRLLPQFSGYDLVGAPASKAKQSVKTEFWSNVPIETLAKYCGGDCDFTLRIMLHLENRLITHNLYHLFRNFYMPLVPIISGCYLRGVPIDKPYLEHLHDKYTKLIQDKEAALMDIEEVAEFNDVTIDRKIDDYIDALEDEIDSGDLTERQIAAREEKISRVDCGEPATKAERALFEPINFGSPKQLINLLYESDYGFEFPIIERSKKGAPSTGEGTLLKLQHQDTSGFINALLELRGLSKLHSTYIQNILEEHLDVNNHIHPSYLPHATVTGRFGSRNPNFQNIPRTSTNPDIKKYITALPDYYFVEIDGSQMELRVAAEMFGDKVMIDIFEKGQNIHVATAAKVFGDDYDYINKGRKDPTHPGHDDAVRKHKTGKVLNFTIFYGAEGRKVAEFVTERTGVHTTAAEGDLLIESWFEAFPQAANGIKKFQKKAREQGFIESPLGRRRRLPILLEPANKIHRRGEWNEALRQSVNAPIQGFASDLTQWGNIQIYKEWLKGNVPNYIQLVSTVHDSLEYMVHKNDIHTVIPQLTDTAAKAAGLKKYMGYEFRKVKQKFSAELGITWGHAEEYRKDTDYVENYHTEITKWRNEKIKLLGNGEV